MTALMYASINGNIDVARLLLDARANIDAISNVNLCVLLCKSYVKLCRVFMKFCEQLCRT